MKKLMLVLALAGCGSTTVDPDNGVTSAQYRQSEQKASDSIAAVVSKLEAGKGKPRTEAWWADIHDNLAVTRDQMQMVLQGSTK